MSYSIIAAVGKNNELGKDNHLIWSLPNDLKFFKQMTMNKSIIMGRNTFESLPKLLPNRHHIVLSSSTNFPPEVEVYRNLIELLTAYEKYPEELFVIGGASIYKQFIDYCDNLYLTEVNASCPEADVYFPTFNKDDYDRTILKENSDNGISYQHVLYRRK